MPLVQIFEHPFSAFLRDPRRIIADLKRGDVLLRRRGRPALRLSQAERDEDRAAAFTALARLLRRLAVADPAAMHDALVEAFPWATFLPESDQTEFATELGRILLASGELDTFASAAQAIREWRATAEVHADPSLARSLRETLEAAGGRVTAPPP